MEMLTVDEEKIIELIRKLNQNGNNEEADFLDEKFEQYNLMDNLLQRLNERYVSERYINSILINDKEMMEVMVALETSKEMYEKFFELFLEKTK